jgi:hypothetical protein
MEDKSKLEEKVISKNCIIATYITKDERSYVLQINYLQGRFISEKLFSNDLDGIELMEEAKELFKTEYDIKEYFGII